MFPSIHAGKFNIPLRLTSQARSLIEDLCRVDVGHRLGNAGSAEVKAHPWFRSVDWDKVRTKQTLPPIVPYVRYDGDAMNYVNGEVDHLRAFGIPGPFDRLDGPVYVPVPEKDGT